jgi:hypothetical protein
MNKSDDAEDDFRQGYVLAFGDLGDFSEFPLIKFLMFSMFTFLIPLTLMNMLIAIMSDTYARVQENAEAADTRSLAEMCHEMEVVVRMFSFNFRRSVAHSAYKYSFFTKVITEEELQEEADRITDEVKGKNITYGSVLSMMKEGFKHIKKEIKHLQKDVHQ